MAAKKPATQTKLPATKKAEADFSPAGLNVLQRINGVMGEIKYVRKTKQVGRGSSAYHAVTHDEVTKALHPLLEKWGIVVMPNLVSDTVVETGTMTSGGTPIIRYEAIYDIMFMSSDERTDFISSRIRAHANDHGDKAPGKAVSYAQKTAMLKVFSLETGEEEEERIEAHPGLVTRQQIEDLQILAEKLGFPVNETLQSLAKRVYRISSGDIGELPSGMYEDAVKRLNRKHADAVKKEKQSSNQQGHEEQAPEEEDAFGG